MRGCEGEVGRPETLGSLWISQVLRFPLDTIVGVPTTVPDWDAEH
jgi:hypothetical protein